MFEQMFVLLRRDTKAATSTEWKIQANPERTAKELYYLKSYPLTLNHGDAALQKQEEKAELGTKLAHLPIQLR